MILALILLLSLSVLLFVWYSSAREPGRPDPDNWQETRSPSMLTGSFTLVVNLPKNPDSVVQFALPLNPDGSIADSAKNMVFYAPFNGDAPMIRQGLKEWLVEKFVQECRFSVFSLTIEMDPDATTPDTYYIYEQNHWYDIVFLIQKILEDRYRLPHQSLLIAGESSGGSWAQQLAVSRPEQVAAAAWCGGDKYLMETLPHPPAPMLALNVWGCPGQIKTAAMAAFFSEKNVPVYSGITPPEWQDLQALSHHAASPEAYTLIQQFLSAIAELREQNAGTVPPPEAWPVQTDSFHGTTAFPSAVFFSSFSALPHDYRQKYYDPATVIADFSLPQATRDHILYFFNPADQPDEVPEDFLYGAKLQNLGISLLRTDKLDEEIDRIQQAVVDFQHQHPDSPLIVCGKGFAGYLAIMATKDLPDGPRIVVVDPDPSDFSTPLPEKLYAGFSSERLLPEHYGLLLPAEPVSGAGKQKVLLQCILQSLKDYAAPLSTP